MSASPPAGAVRASSTILLLRERSSLEVFMVKRPARGSFPGAHVFPGGVVDAADRSAASYALCDGLDDPEASRRLNLPRDGLAYYVAAVRETFEETGYLLAHDSAGRVVTADALGDAAADWRERLATGRAALVDLCREFGVRPAVERLAYTSYWLTPRSEKRRYATRFFTASVPAGQRGQHDGGELVDSFWIAPSAALDRATALTLPPPTRAQLQRLATFTSVDAALRAARRCEADGVPCVFPELTGGDGGTRRFRLAELATAPDPVEFAGPPR